MQTAASSKDNFDVVIVGLGPVGATLANLLGLCGVSTLVLERESAIFQLPRAVHFDDEVMRVFQTVGIAEELKDFVRINPGMRFVDADGGLLLDWPRPQEVGPQGWHASYRFHQPDLERLLRAALQRFAHVDVRTDSEVESIAENGEVCALQYRNRVSDTRHGVTARFVVGCDGARSLVRRCMQTAMFDHGFQERWLVVDALLKADKPELGDHTIQYCDPNRPSTYARNPKNRRRWEIAVLDGESSDAIAEPDSVWRLLERWVAPHEVELERTAVYTFHSLVADEWRRGGLLLAGDAAHQTPPFMGQGMCAGIRDAANLAWKLALCVQGRAEDALLDSYQSERRPHTQAYVETAIRLGGLINRCDTEDALRGTLEDPAGGARMESIMPSLGPGLAAGNRARAGTLGAQPGLRDHTRLDDKVGYAPVLLARGEVWRQELKSACLAPSIALLLDDDQPEIAGYLRQLDCAAVLLRPDRYILGTANDGGELSALCAGAPHSPLATTETV